MDNALKMKIIGIAFICVGFLLPVDGGKCGEGHGEPLMKDGVEVFCGRGPGREDCPESYSCTIDPTDRFAVCCLDAEVETGGTTGEGEESEVAESPGTGALDSICTLPPEAGLCRAAMPRWFFNSASGICETFTYGGCRGNENNFETMEECQSVCSRSRSSGCPSLDNCQLTCEHGREFDERECEICQCLEPCRDKQCPSGQECQVVQVQCIRAPCPPIGTCVEPQIDPPVQGCPTVMCDISCQGGLKVDKNGCEVCQCGEQGGVEEAPVTTTSSSVCSQPVVVGRCRAAMRRWHYDQNTDTCEIFTYGGCGGNQNNFESQADCEAKCRTPISTTPAEDKSIPPPRCLQEASVGPCEAIIPRWHYDNSSGTCKQFDYGGCEGNDNRFDSRVECETFCNRRKCSMMMCRMFCQYGFKKGEDGCDICSCNEPCDNVNCPTGQTCHPSAKGDSYVGECRSSCSEIMCAMFCPAGFKKDENGCDICQCADEETPPSTVVPIGQKDIVCSQPVVVGRCRAAMRRWHYNQDTDTCEIFTYGGCGGNQNNFENQGDCEAKCRTPISTTPAEDKSIPPPRCLQEVSVGPCEAIIPRWHYDNSSGTCKQFDYGGCEGNDNRFDSRVECETFCNRRKCSMMMCRMFCQYGFKKGEDGCDICSCNEPCDNVNCPTGQSCHPSAKGDSYVGECRSSCSEIMCAMFCPAGFKKDDKGCDICQCAEEEPLPSTVVPIGQKDIVCSQPVVVGRCRAAMRRWHYNQDTDTCEIFTYGGCGGNQNNFESQADCEAKCRSPISTTPAEDKSIPPPRCLQEVSVGPCEAIIPRWHYDNSSGTCKQFDYGGCEGNDNRFDSRVECETFCNRRKCSMMMCRMFCQYGFKKGEDGCDICSCNEPCDNVNCPTGQTCHPSAKGDSYVGECRSICSEIMCAMFCPAGFKKDDNGCDICRCAEEELPPSTVIPIGQKDIVCSQPVVVGRCRAAMRRWHYNQDTDTCEIFTYGGCGGNQNNFESLADCEAKCRTAISTTPVDKSKPPQQCLQDVSAGPCEAVIPRWHYDTISGTCKQFDYGGCEGNDNRFESRVECETFCNRRKCSMMMCRMFCQYGFKKGEDGCDICSCNEPCDESPCPPDHSCSVVLQGEEYVSECSPEDTSKPPARCLQEVSVGPCEAIIPRWHYDNSSGTCKQFDYGGCEGNDNRFETMVECETICNRRKCSIAMCMMYCRYGFKKGEDGCDICSCNEPCEENPCSPDHTCSVVKRGEEFVSECTPEDKSEPPPQCLQEVSVGPCEAIIPRWHYDNSSGTCKQFDYGGCEGNDNRFETMVECETFCNRRKCSIAMCMMYCRYGFKKGEDGCDICSCNEPCEENPCSPDHSCSVVKRGEEFVSECTPEDKSKPPQQCLQEVSVGPCKAIIPRWHYDNSSGICKQFDYGGCEGNDNRFDSRVECETFCNRRKCSMIMCRMHCQYGFKKDEDGCDICSCNDPCDENPCAPDHSCTVALRGDKYVSECTLEDKSKPPQQCLQEVSVGPCEAIIPRWHYDNSSGTCKQFDYGGCQGNDNRFDSRVECETFCNRRKCSMFMCRMHCRYGFKKDDDGCDICSCNEPCDENPCAPDHSCTVALRGDKYVSECTLEDKSKPPQRCLQEVSVGPCEAIIPRWHYDNSSRTCKQFDYGGCQGNDNRFDSRVECETFCNRRKCSMFMCRMHCRYGFKKDDDGCDICSCNEPCDENPCAPDHSCAVVLRGDEYVSECTPEDTSKPPAQCLQELSVGPCEAILPRWHYDTSSGTCKQFDYGGCEGNDNRFESRIECETFCNRRKCSMMMCRMYCRYGFKKGEDGCDICSCNEPCEDVDCPSGESCQPTLKDDIYVGQCKSVCPDVMCAMFCVEGFQKDDNGCDICACKQTPTTIPTTTRPPCVRVTCSNACPAGYETNEFGCMTCRCNPTTTPSDTSKPPQQCLQEVSVGPCEAIIPRWHYDTISGTCKQFDYGGCGGNDNRFESRVECETFCNRRKCSMIMCRMYCQYGFKKGEDGCDICSCNEPCEDVDCPAGESCQPTLNNDIYVGQCMPVCPDVMCAMFCVEGFQKDDNGCDICACKQTPTTIPTTTRPPCVRVTCSNACPAGYETNEFGCMTCRCNPTTTPTGCQPVRCRMHCRFGWQRNEAGCEICACREPTTTTLMPVPSTITPNPCLVSNACSSGQLCVLRRKDGKSVKECINVDGSSRPTRCTLPKMVGTCVATHNRWFFNDVSKRCESFTYSGCQGNENSFMSKGDCEMACQPLKCEMKTAEECIDCPLGYSKDSSDCIDCTKCWDICMDKVCPSGHTCQITLQKGLNTAECKPEGCPVDNKMDCLKYCHFGYEKDEKGCEKCICFDPCKGYQCPESNVCVTRQQECDGDGCEKKLLKPVCVKPESFRKPGFCPRLDSFMAGVCVETCRHDTDCSEDSKCCSNGCGKMCMPAFEQDKKHTGCEKQQMQAMVSLRINPSKPVFVPRCTAKGSWQSIQCMDSFGVCWCVNTRDGSRISGSQVRGVPQCGSRFAPREQAVCEYGIEIHQCSPLLCLTEICPTAPDSVCRINPCGGCSVEFYSPNGLRANCEVGASQCETTQASIHRDHWEKRIPAMLSSEWWNESVMRMWNELYRHNFRAIPRTEDDLKPRGFRPRGPAEPSGRGERGSRGEEVRPPGPPLGPAGPRGPTTTTPQPTNRPIVNVPEQFRGKWHDFPVVGVFFPKCSGTGNAVGFEWTQCAGELCWCVDAAGQPLDRTLSRGWIICDRNGIARESMTKLLTCQKRQQPMMCDKACIKPMCLGEETAICVADPCNNCQVTWHKSNGDPVESCYNEGPAPANQNRCLLRADHGPCIQNGIKRWAYVSQSRTCEEFSYGGCGGNDNNFHTEAQCSLTCGGMVCPGSRTLDVCEDVCLGASCDTFPEAHCVVDPCKCTASFVDPHTGRSVKCDNVVGVCNRMQSQYKKVHMAMRPDVPTQLRRQMDTSQQSTDRKSMWDKMNIECDEDGNFKPRQCSSEFCWCVDRQGHVIDGTHDRNMDVKCDAKIIKTVIGKFSIKADYKMVQQYGFEFQESIEEQLKEKLLLVDLRIMHLKKGSIIVTFEVTSPNDKMMVSKVDQFKTHVQATGVVFIFKDKKMPVIKGSVEVDIVYKEEIVDGKTEPWVLRGNNKLIVILVPIGFVLLFLLIVALGLCCCRQTKRGHSETNSENSLYGSDADEKESQKDKSQKLKNMEIACENGAFHDTEKIRSVSEVVVNGQETV